MTREADSIEVRGAEEHNLKHVSVAIPRRAITTITGVSGSGKSSLAFDTVLAECQRRFFYTLSHYSRQFLDIGTRPKVTSIQGLSPAIGLAQNETQLSRRASIGTQSDISELLGVSLARFGTQSCPDHKLPTGGLSQEQIGQVVLEKFQGKTVAVAAPLVTDKKGSFTQHLRKFAEMGFRYAWIDNEVLPLDPLPILVKEEKHTIDLIIDWVKVKGAVPEGRLARSLNLAKEMGEGYISLFEVVGDTTILPDTRVMYSSLSGCSKCGFSWPKLDSRHFSRNSLGRCTACNGYGTQQVSEEDAASDDADPLMAHGVDLAAPCVTCAGSGFDPKLQAIKWRGKSVGEWHALSMKEFLLGLPADGEETREVEERVLHPMREALQRFNDIGIGYLSAGRRMLTLSSGEAQRVRLASILAESLRGVIYVLDEPSQGLHQVELESLRDALYRLKERGNTVIIVDHDQFLMRQSDWIIDLGPGGGEHGGSIMAKFAPQNAADFANLSITAAGLAKEQKWQHRRTRSEAAKDFIQIQKPRLHNLRMRETIKIPLQRLTAVTGRSGAGKSSLIMGVLWRNMEQRLIARNAKNKAVPKTWFGCEDITGFEGLDSVQVIDRKPLAKSSVSMPATYLDVFGDLRDLYAQLPDAQVAGLSARHFSLFHEGGRCENCKGKGYISISMKFLADARELCDVCQGARYDARVTEIRFQGMNISDVLAGSLEQALQHFQHHKKIVRKLTPAIDLGLGYLKMGQPSASLSGGEAQRLKLAPLLAKSFRGATLILLDEPTTGLHRVDVDRLMGQLQGLVERGHTVVVMEHHEAVIEAADWILELGPGAGADGGLLTQQGPA